MPNTTTYLIKVPALRIDARHLRLNFRQRTGVLVGLSGQVLSGTGLVGSERTFDDVVKREGHHQLVVELSLLEGLHLKTVLETEIR
jgi:hypothetical protein